MKRFLCVLGVLALLSAAGTNAQTVQVNPQNRTIELTAESSIEVEADLAVITIGYHNYGPTQETTYNENLRVADAILKSWTGAGLPEKEVSTHSLSLSHVSTDDLKNMDAGDRKQRQFEASQSWTVTARTEVAQKLLDLALVAGGNDVSDPEWKLSDPNAVEAKAYASALDKAHGIAEQMARSFGTKVGALLYATNQTRAVSLLASLVTLNTESAMIGRRATVPPPVHPVKLLPQKVQRSVVVRAIFALE